MTDIVDMLRKGLEEHEMLAVGHRLFDDAADEIERLRGRLDAINGAVYDIEQTLLDALEQIAELEDMPDEIEQGLLGALRRIEELEATP